MKTRMLLMLTTLVAFLAYSPLQGVANEDARSEKLNAFARAFGLVRFFHPSDQASLVDWEKMALYGVNQAMDSPDDESTRDFLQRLFEPIVVDLEFYEGDEKPRPETKKVPAKELLAWQHYGFGVMSNNTYRSVRLNRDRAIASPASRGGFLRQTVDATEFTGKEFRYRFQIKTKDSAVVRGVFRVILQSGEIGTVEITDELQNQEWQVHSIGGKIDENAKEIVVGVAAMGRGTAMIDNVSVQYKAGENWKPIELINSDFEDDSKKLTGWQFTSPEFTTFADANDPAHGKQCARIERKITRVPGNPLFRTIPELGEVVDDVIAPNLRIRMPLTLPISHKYTAGENEATDQLISSIEAIQFNREKTAETCLANTVILWNVFQHFYPYFEQVECDWDAALAHGLSKAAKAESREQMTNLLKWMVAQLHDGHGNVVDSESFGKMKSSKVNFVYTQDKLVVSASETESFQQGDIVLQINGQPAETFLDQKETLISGSPQWKRYRSVRNLSSGSDPLSMVLNRDGETINSELKFDSQAPVAVAKGEMCRILVKGQNENENIWYVDMGRAEPADVNKIISDLAQAKGVVLDLRGYPRGTQFLFQHMTDKKLQSQKWQIPKILHPSGADMKEIETAGRWQMPPRSPRFKGKMVFITDASAISYAESCMSIVANYQLGEIIGSPTAGANGNINPFPLPGGYRIIWTGMRVMNHDDSQHHVNGVQPTIPMEPTVEGIRQGKDELLEKAIELISKS